VETDSRNGYASGRGVLLMMMVLMEPLGSAEPRLKTTALGVKHASVLCFACSYMFGVLLKG